ncbi:type I pullulanase [Oceanobacillus polygoni]|uniref:Pullulanase n=1 Tax=Oceanobacillus polygoni TaxID=1235259 RepID=A0A9X1CKS6_9BACI|nr:type I pullulanase [Oceanobacillus polygoni]MBP2079527.1 pullulanase [Oceanobacillus polygoni]
MKKQVAWIDNIRTLTISDKHIRSLFNNDMKELYLFWEAENKVFTIKQIRNINESTVQLDLAEEIPLGEELFLHCGETEIPVYPRAIVRTEWFDKHYAAIDQPLGAICGPVSTVFSVWAPTATSVKVILNKDTHLLNKLDKGVWKLELKGDWHGQPYEYEVTVNGTNERVNDPYAKAMLANSKKAVVVDFSRTEQPINNKRPTIQQLQDAIIYELHIRDATIDQESGVQNRGKFLGLAEIGTITQNGFSTGLSYLKELGCTHVQLLPVNDFARVDELHPDDAYNWGYDPLFFQTPEGSYSVLPDRPIARINELKAMIQAIHQEGIAVILDVVFNHVFVLEESPFEQLVPGYYFRYHPDGSLSNGTGVGNDIASERSMVRKFILDTIDFMLSEYQVDGFRFDLMGVMDIETMQQIEKRCQEEETLVMLLGEGWDLPTALDSSLKATSNNANQLKGIRFFNDYFRDSLKGNLFEQQDNGYINGAGRFLERMPHLLSGAALDANNHASISDVNQTINYVECHDNHTLWDRLRLTNPDLDDHARKKMHQLATGITLLSQGVPFIHAGQEWYRSKQGDENSYISGDSINMLDWKKREQEQENIAFVKALIALRKRYSVFRMTSQREIQQRFHVLEAPYPVFGFTLLGDKEDFSIYINPTREKFDLQLPSSGKWKRAVSNIASEKDDIIGEFTSIHAYEIIVFQKTRNRTTKEVAVVLPSNA